MNLQKNIRKVLKEWYATIDREKLMGMTYDDMEKIINKVMGKKYDWWKGIEIRDVIYAEMGENITIYGVLNVDKKWGEGEWYKHQGGKFQGNSGFVDNMNGYITTLDDVIGFDMERELSKDLTMIFIGSTNFHEAIRTRMTVLRLKFV
jgi:hypothetical protein